MLKRFIVLHSLLFASLFGYIRYGVNPPPIARYAPIMLDRGLQEFSIVWSLDSETMYFYTLEDSGGLNYYQYDVNTDTLESISRLPRITESPLDKNMLELFSVSDLYVSPNGKYSIYLKEHCVTDERLYANYGGTICYDAAYSYVNGSKSVKRVSWGSFSNIYWSRNSETIILLSRGNGLTRVTAHRFMPDTSAFELRLNVAYDIWRKGLVDISPDGNIILLTRLRPYETGLHLWDIRKTLNDPSWQNVNTFPMFLNHTYVAGATFLPESNEEILAITQDGLIQFNIRTGDSEILYPELNTGWIDRAYFSPDAKTVAIYSNNTSFYGWPCQLYVIPLDDRFVAPLELDHVCPFYG